MRSIRDSGQIDLGPKISWMLMIPSPRISMKFRLRGGAAPTSLSGAVPPHPDDVVRNELVAAGDELQRALALADAAVPDDQRPDPKDPEQAAGQGGLPVAGLRPGATPGLSH